MEVCEQVILYDTKILFFLKNGLKNGLLLNMIFSIISTEMGTRTKTEQKKKPINRFLSSGCSYIPVMVRMTGLEPARLPTGF